MNSDLTQVAVDLARRALVLSMELSLPMLLIGLIVGVLVSLLQALTQIQEQTLSFIPKLVAVTAAMFALLPWMLTVITEYTREVFVQMRTLLAP
ncbi:MAG: flagellar biosynthesis protein FliQ [Planctomycetes bacterium]|nr:flagellar biosynthesis protein FliQ [Planctomycetota bacterium]